ncbi:MAG: molybdopterin-guanine dinucleotide biosynthesis protein B [Candidatus Omnitrophica bacterium]|nr:molybdopterin-guanine dinucleotide biosynthesis protein B [Candidatus Omnitrophota bacterium]
MKRKPVAISVVGVHNSGKTTLIEKLIPILKARGLRVGTIKHTCHEGFEIDVAGKDTSRHRSAGSEAVAISSRTKTVFVREFKSELTLVKLLELYESQDLVLVEGFKKSSLPKVEVFRKELGKNLVAAEDPDLLAVYSEDAVKTSVPVFSSARIDELAEFIEREFFGTK